MDIVVSAKNLDLTPSMRELAEQKFAKLAKFWSAMIRLHIEVSVSRHHKHGEIFVVYGWIETPGRDIRVTVESSTFASAVDTLYAKLERAVTKAKGRMGS